MICLGLHTNMSVEFHYTSCECDYYSCVICILIQSYNHVHADEPETPTVSYTKDEVQTDGELTSSKIPIEPTRTGMYVLHVPLIHS